MKKKAEEVLRRIEELEVWHGQMKQKISNSKHQLTERQYLNIIQSMGQAVHVFDRQYRIRFWNPIAEKIYGVSAAEIIGITQTEILVDPKDAVFAEYLLERTVNGETWSGEFPVTNRKGETFVIMCTNTPFRDHNGRLIGGICVFSDSRPYRSQTTSNLDSSKVKFKEVMRDDDAIQSPFGVFSRKINLWPWKGNKDEEEDVVAKLGRFGWQRFQLTRVLDSSFSSTRVPDTALRHCSTSRFSALTWAVYLFLFSVLFDQQLIVAVTDELIMFLIGFIFVRSGGLSGEIITSQITWEDLTTKRLIGQDGTSGGGKLVAKEFTVEGNCREEPAWMVSSSCRAGGEKGERGATMEEAGEGTPLRRRAVEGELILEKRGEDEIHVLT
ncbi:hypothetical protein E3N88_14301 [Mikania micrantha]|uniref:PAS domain-containing protein n=1 Tax=Mikania micrantha TaxID=192012 RepID=A0A5N6P2S3_9ASTR|nr:hypothetical protein E3N88_14301 [Mikania micrantha]